MSSYQFNTQQYQSQPSQFEQNQQLYLQQLEKLQEKSSIPCSPLISHASTQPSITSINSDFSPYQQPLNKQYYQEKPDYIVEKQKPLQQYFVKPQNYSQQQNLLQNKQFEQKKEVNQIQAQNQNVKYNLPPKTDYNKKYTLVLDLDETLIHTYKNDKIKGELQFNIRPFTEQFLRNLSQHFEIVIFTASDQEYCDAIVDSIDQYNSISHRLFNTHMKLGKDGFVKDLSQLERDISKTLIVDNLPQNFVEQEENGIEIRDYYDDNKDNLLLKLQDYLLQMVHLNTQDVRQFLKPIKQLFK